VAGANTVIALRAKIRRWLIQLYLAYTSDNKLIIYRFKEGFLWDMYRKRGYVFCGRKLKEIGRNCNLCRYGSV